MTSKSYTWKGADGGSWGAASNWDDGSGHSTGSPGDLDFAQFVAFSGKVTGAASADILDVGPASHLTLGGNGAFNTINIGIDFSGNFGDASLTIGAGDVVSAALANVGSVLGGQGTLTADGTFSTPGGIVMDPAGQACNIVVDNGGAVFDGVSLTMAAGGLVKIGATGQMVIGNSSGGGTNGALTVDTPNFFYGEGTIAGNVIDNGLVETFNAGLAANKLTITGAVTGSGTLDVVQEMDLGGAVGANVTISLFANGGSNAGLLRLAKPLAELGTLATMSTGSIIALTGLSFQSVKWTPGELTVSGASGMLILKTSGDHSHQSFVVTPDAISGTDIVVGQELLTPTILDSGDIGGYVGKAGDTAAQTLGGAATPSGAVSVYLNGASTPAYTTKANASGVWSVTIGHLADGNYSFVAKDASGSSAPLVFTVDTVAPAAPTMKAPTYAGSTSSGHWNLVGVAETGSSIRIFDGALISASNPTGLVASLTDSASNGAWSYAGLATSAANSLTKAHDYTAMAADKAGNISSRSGDYWLGTAGNDVFRFKSAQALLTGGVWGDGGVDTVAFSAAVALTDAAFAKTHLGGLTLLAGGVTASDTAMIVALNGASSATLGANAAAAKIATLRAGTGATTIVDTNSGKLSVVASAMTAAATLTLSSGAGTEGFAVSGLSATLKASLVKGALSVVTGATSLSITTGSGANVINAAAMTSGQTLTLSGSAKASLSIGGNLAAGSYAGALTIQATGAVGQTIAAGAGADIITVGPGDHVAGGAGADVFVYKSGLKSLVSQFDTIADFGNGADRFQIGHTVATASFHSLANAGTGNLLNDLGALLAGAHAANLAAGGADVVTLSGGSDAGRYVVIEEAGTAGFNANLDAVIKVQNAAAVSAGSFMA